MELAVTRTTPELVSGYSDFFTTSDILRLLDALVPYAKSEPAYAPLVIWVGHPCFKTSLRRRLFYGWRSKGQRSQSSFVLQKYKHYSWCNSVECSYDQSRFIHWAPRLSGAGLSKGSVAVQMGPNKLDLTRFSGNKFRSASSKGTNS
ncbi:hypothetical protein TNCV_4350581 [Trichonephila clavipes]|nr:hypothetical protein TNCV_4350581 [Trichonephila clavipes]